MEKPQLYIANHYLTMWTWFLARVGGAPSAWRAGGNVTDTLRLDSRGWPSPKYSGRSHDKRDTSRQLLGVSGGRMKQLSSLEVTKKPGYYLAVPLPVKDTGWIPAWQWAVMKITKNKVTIRVGLTYTGFIIANREFYTGGWLDRYTFMPVKNVKNVAKEMGRAGVGVK